MAIAPTKAPAMPAAPVSDCATTSGSVDPSMRSKVAGIALPALSRRKPKKSSRPIIKR